MNRKISSGNWRGIKRDVWEGGHRVPFMVSWPAGNISGGIEISELISLTDIFATVAEIIGFKLPDNAAEDSYSALSAMKGEPGIRKSMVYHRIDGGLAIREGDWVYIRETGLGNKRNPHPEWYNEKLGIKNIEAPHELFNLKSDPVQTTNLYPNNRTKAEDLEKRLQIIIDSDGKRIEGTE